jgi:hypothetical protein
VLALLLLMRVYETSDEAMCALNFALHPEALFQSAFPHRRSHLKQWSLERKRQYVSRDSEKS